ncbi:MAG TPA: hypothetical protein VHP58_00015 [Alphaproteobacteria bacterium]|nr:hypothetical protein [Alphaproteobacteria bacterium]
MKPLRQGDIDSLCGLYAIINAIRTCSTYAAAPSLSQARQLFGELIKHHEATFPTFARVGMDVEQVEAALKFALKFCFEKYGLHISYRYVEFTGLKAMQAALEKHLDDQGRHAAIVAADAHSTVVTEVMGKLWRLCDSYRYEHLYCIGEQQRIQRCSGLLRARPELHTFLLKYDKGPKYGIGPKNRAEKI